VKQAQVINLKTKQPIGSLIGFAVSESGERFAVVRPKSRALDTLIRVETLNSNYEVRP
jgi:hypothetical protein